MYYFDAAVAAVDDIGTFELLAGCPDKVRLKDNAYHIYLEELNSPMFTLTNYHRLETITSTKLDYFSHLLFKR
ncbi:hypothetical protein GCM10009119_41520 [Algoriphagus jejuensis]|uniref:Uncharacterized protein n=1 Tax=Algoriphagus jejuensis TaxID=419934 RepID=A0ABP3YKD7_9BACT